VPASASIGFYAGPGYSYYRNLLTSDYINPSFGFSAGIVFKTTTVRIVSFRGDLAFGYTRSHLHFSLDEYYTIGCYNGITGEFNFFYFSINPQIQFNLLRNRGLFVSLGVSPVIKSVTGEGTQNYSHGEYSRQESFSGASCSYLFVPLGFAVGIGVGYQKFHLGKTTLFTEAKVSYDFAPLTYSVYGCGYSKILISTLTIGILLYSHKR
jgi:hypothetical protein